MGVAIGCGAGVVPMYLTELSDIQHRGLVGTMHMTVIALGDVVSLIVGMPQLFGECRATRLDVQAPRSCGHWRPSCRSLPHSSWTSFFHSVRVLHATRSPSTTRRKVLPFSL